MLKKCAFSLSGKIIPACPLIALGDGALELFHQPQSDAVFSNAFEKYLSALKSLHSKGAITAGYTDRPRAALVVKMLEYSGDNSQQIQLNRVEDLAIFSQILNPGQRSAVFGLWSSSSQKYTGDLALHFFYLNVGSQKFPWIARVEIPAWVAVNPKQIGLLQQRPSGAVPADGHTPLPLPASPRTRRSSSSFQRKGTIDHPSDGRPAAPRPGHQHAI